MTIPTWPLQTIVIFANVPDEVYNLSGRASAWRVSCKETGFLAATVRVPMALHEANLYLGRGRAELYVVQGPRIVWHGRIEDVEYNGGDLVLVAFGFFAALDDLTLQATFLDNQWGRWTIGQVEQFSNAAPQRYAQSIDRQLYIAPRKGEDFSTAARGYFAYYPPDQYQTDMINASFDYDMNGSSSWVLRLDTGTADWTLTGTGSQQTGSQTVTFSSTGWSNFRFLFFYNSGTPTEYTGETGDTYAKITNIKVRGVAAASLTADEVVGEVVDIVTGVNPGHLSTDKTQVQAMTTEIGHLVADGETARDVIGAVADMGDDDQGRVEFGVWEDKRLFFRSRGSAAIAYQAIIDGYRIRRSIGDIVNSAYGLYRWDTTSGRQRRTTVGSDADSVARYGVTRRREIDSRGLTSAIADTYRDALITAAADPVPEVEIEIAALIANDGAQVAPYVVRAGDTVTLLNATPGLVEMMSGIVTYTVEKVDVDAQGTRIRLERPERTVDELLAQALA